jgi:Copper type II ascorbate-dependent monooxygenase, C-terminal domain/Copper type II ascorbate-dependent monooxygenase, N-terminal domain
MRTPRLFLFAILAACSGSTSGVTPGASDGGDTTDGGAAPDGGTTGPSGLPCDVEKIVSANCQSCHARSPLYGAPMPLVTWADLQAPAKSDATKKVYELVGARIHDDAKPMPQAPNPRLTAADTATLDGWIAQGAPQAQTATGCDAPPPPTDGGIGPTSCTPDEHMRPTAAWSMPQGTNDQYTCYLFDVPRTTKRHVVALAPVIGNPKIVHHLLLFQATTGAGSVTTAPSPCASGGGSGWRIVYGWAPGGAPMEMPPEAGFPEDPGTTHYVVQVHYNNINHLAGETDTSGFDLCTTDQLRPNDADVIAFGTTSINIPPHATLDTTCSVAVQSTFEGAHVFAASPHMHKLGTKQITTITSASGTVGDLGKKDPFDFQSQYWVPVNQVMHTGDTVKTRCVWNNTTDTAVTFGENTENEMCFSFTMYYPRVQLPSWAAPAYVSKCQ